MLAPNTILQNRYRIIRELGHGGMGTVYEAIDQRVNCLVALKSTRAASAREAGLLANLRHAALPKVSDYFSDENGHFLVMEFIPGDDFEKLLKIRGRPFPESDVVSWADQLLDLLHYLHSRQLLHRDIKPSNLKLTGDGELFLLDFGLAKGAVGQMPTLTSDKSQHGYTLQYASLEQILNRGTDARSDLYSLGATLYHLVTGALPVDAHTRDTWLRKQKGDPLTPVQDENPEVSRHFADLIHCAMSIDANMRPQSAKEMRDALRSVHGSQSRAVPAAVEPKSTEPSPAPVPPIPTIPAPPPSPFRFEGQKDDLIHNKPAVTKPWPRRFWILVSALILALIIAAILPFLWLPKPSTGNSQNDLASQASPLPTQEAVNIQSSPNPSAPAVSPAPTKTDRNVNSAPAEEDAIAVRFNWQRSEPKIFTVKVTRGSRVEQGSTLFEIESEGAQGYEIGGRPLPRQRITEYFTSPVRGVVVSVSVTTGQSISMGDILLFVREE